MTTQANTPPVPSPTQSNLELIIGVSVAGGVAALIVLVVLVTVICALKRGKRKVVLQFRAARESKVVNPPPLPGLGYVRLTAEIYIH